MEIRKRLRAFTLVELLIVITIIGILAVALVPRITGAPAKARDAARVADLQQIATGLELYADDNGGNYPAISDCVSNLTLTNYMSAVPDDPSDIGAGNCGTGYGYTGIDVAGDGSYEGYILIADLENDTASDDRFQKPTVALVATASAGSQVSAACVDDCVAFIGR